MAVRIDEIPLLQSERDLVVLLVSVEAVDAGRLVDGLAIEPDGVETDDGRGGQIRGRCVRRIDITLRMGGHAVRGVVHRSPDQALLAAGELEAWVDLHGRRKIEPRGEALDA